MSWTPTTLGWSALAGFLLTFFNHVNLCLNQKIPDPFGWQGEWWSAMPSIFFHP